MRFPRLSLIFLTACILLTSGCGQDDDIRKFTVTHEERETIRLSVAILPRKDLVWFVRVSGPEKQVAEHLPEFETFVRSIQFTDRKKAPITWKAPKGWVKDAPTSERFAGFRIDAKPKQLEVTITRFPADKYSLMSNIHRWQKQINLPLAESADELQPPMVTRGLLDTKSDQPVTWVNMTGLGVHTVSKAPVQADVKDPLNMQMKQLDVPFQYQVPVGWVEKDPRDSITAVLIEVKKDDDVLAEVTLTMLPGAGGKLDQNINRWRKQVKLPPLAPADIAKATEEWKVAGLKAVFVDLANPQGPPTTNRTLGVIVPIRRMGATCFIKMSGPIEWVERNKDAFEAFVKSFELEGN